MNEKYILKTLFKTRDGKAKYGSALTGWFFDMTVFHNKQLLWLRAARRREAHGSIMGSPSDSTPSMAAVILYSTRNG